MKYSFLALIATCVSVFAACSTSASAADAICEKVCVQGNPATECRNGTTCLPCRATVGSSIVCTAEIGAAKCEAGKIFCGSSPGNGEQSSNSSSSSSSNNSTTPAPTTAENQRKTAEPSSAATNTTAAPNTTPAPTEDKRNSTTIPPTTEAPTASSAAPTTSTPAPTTTPAPETNTPVPTTTATTTTTSAPTAISNSNQDSSSVAFEPLPSGAKETSTKVPATSASAVKKEGSTNSDGATNNNADISSTQDGAAQQTNDASMPGWTKAVIATGAVAGAALLAAATAFVVFKVREHQRQKVRLQQEQYNFSLAFNALETGRGNQRESSIIPSIFNSTPPHRPNGLGRRVNEIEL